ncbi:MAG: hypothetical protein ACK47R_14400 [Planctomycetia bacterium]
MTTENTESRTSLVATAAILMVGALLFPLVGPSMQGANKAWFVAGLSLVLVFITSFQFMHLRQDGKKLWLVLVPTIILGMVILAALLPDTVLYRSR